MGKVVQVYLILRWVLLFLEFISLQNMLFSFSVHQGKKVSFVTSQESSCCCKNKGNQDEGERVEIGSDDKNDALMPDLGVICLVEEYNSVLIDCGHMSYVLLFGMLSTLDRLLGTAADDLKSYFKPTVSHVRAKNAPPYGCFISLYFGTINSRPV
ncbi:unnamed protein product [Cuscuta epithymum]|uniref:Uncharacterized protein n=1 Tax=Cuscuta epithymum TaxID=186058 RepID=A0AAV0CAH3_9ASTE|nr:unnamed protein product [Cuscuta epithymum]